MARRTGKRVVDVTGTEKKLIRLDWQRVEQLEALGWTVLPCDGQRILHYEGDHYVWLERETDVITGVDVEMEGKRYG